MNDEFNKLDTFMREHRPGVLEVKPRSLPQEGPWWLRIAALATTMLIVLLVTGMYWQERRNDHDVYGLLEDMEWESDTVVEADEIGDMVALAD